MKREPVLLISTSALVRIRHWLEQPSFADADPELLCSDLPSWIATCVVKVLDQKPAIVTELRTKGGLISLPITFDPSGFGVVRLLTALRGTCMVDHREKGGRPYVKIFSDAASSAGIVLRRILSGITEGEKATSLGDDPLDLRACVTGFSTGSWRDSRDQAHAYAEALSRFDTDTPSIVGIKSREEYKDLITQAFERHWQELEGSLPDAA
jgi:hypothetical protein